MSSFQLNVNALPFSPSGSLLKAAQDLQSESPTAAGASAPSLNANAAPFVPFWSPAKSVQCELRDASPEPIVTIQKKPELSDEEVIRRVVMDLNQHLPDVDLLDHLRAEVRRAALSGYDNKL